MKKVILSFVIFSLIFTTGCSVFDRGNYEKDRVGYVLHNGYIVNYHTNSVGEIDVFDIDKIMTFFDVLDYISFDYKVLSENEIFNSYLSPNELSKCNSGSTIYLPRFIRIANKTYFYNLNNDKCTYDEYTFHSEGFIEGEITETDLSKISPIENHNKTIFTQADFSVNPFDTVVFIEDIKYNSQSDEWEKKLITHVPMSLKQSGLVYKDILEWEEQINILERYVISKQSIYLLEVKDNYLEIETNNIWSERTTDALGRDHEIIKKVDLDGTLSILEVIENTLMRLGMF